MNSAMVFEDPYRQAQHANLTGMQKNKMFFKDLGKGAWKSGSGFGKVGALYAGSECVIEGVRPAAVGDGQELTFLVGQYRARNDIWNSVYAGAFSGAVLGRNSGLKAMLFGGAGFALFSAAIDTYIRWVRPFPPSGERFGEDALLTPFVLSCRTRWCVLFPMPVWKRLPVLTL